MPARKSIRWESYENMQTAWLLPFYSDKEVDVYMIANGDAYPRDAKRKERNVRTIYSVILSVLDPRKREYLKDYSLDFEHAYMTTIYEHFQHLL
jgi:hypothetical protein